MPLPWSLVVLHHPIINNALELYIKRDLSFLLLLLAVVAVPSEARRPLNATVFILTKKFSSELYQIFNLCCRLLFRLSRQKYRSLIATVFKLMEE